MSCPAKPRGEAIGGLAKSAQQRKMDKAHYEEEMLASACVDFGEVIGHYTTIQANGQKGKAIGYWQDVWPNRPEDRRCGAMAMNDIVTGLRSTSRTMRQVQDVGWLENHQGTPRDWMMMKTMHLDVKMKLITYGMTTERIVMITWIRWARAITRRPAPRNCTAGPPAGGRGRVPTVAANHEEVLIELWHRSIMELPIVILVSAPLLIKRLWVLQARATKKVDGKAPLPQERVGGTVRGGRLAQSPAGASFGSGSADWRRPWTEADSRQTGRRRSRYRTREAPKKGHGASLGAGGMTGRGSEKKPRKGRSSQTAPKLGGCVWQSFKDSPLRRPPRRQGHSYCGYSAGVH